MVEGNGRRLAQRRQKRIAYTVSLWIALIVIFGCAGSARMIRRDQSGGVLALEGSRDSAMEDAHEQMRRHCGFNQYEIVGEEEVIVGEETTSTSYGGYQGQARQQSSAQVYGGGGYGTAYGQSTTHSSGTQHQRQVTRTQAVTENRIAYVCRQPPPSAQYTPDVPPDQIHASPE